MQLPSLPRPLLCWRAVGSVALICLLAEPAAANTKFAFESPATGSAQAGVALLSGWACNAQHVEIVLRGTEKPNGLQPERVVATYGGPRDDVKGECNGKSKTGFSAQTNLNRLGTGPATAVLWIDGEARATNYFYVSKPTDQNFPRGLSYSLEIPDFPTATEKLHVLWTTSTQSFTIAKPGAVDPPIGQGTCGTGSTRCGWDNPQPQQNTSGILELNGWACDAKNIEIVLTSNTGAQEKIQVPCCTERGDASCKNKKAGFAATVNVNRMGSGDVSAELYIDGVLASQRPFVVTRPTDMNFYTGDVPPILLPNFPESGKSTTVVWEQSTQNYEIETVFSGQGQTNVTEHMNAAIASETGNSPRVYLRGNGLVVRGLADGQTASVTNVDPKVVAGSLVVNDIFAPNLIYLGGFGSTSIDDATAGVVAVYDSNAPAYLFGVGLQDGAAPDSAPVYNQGVFYAADANSVDGRCRYEEKDGQFQQWDCRKFADGQYTPPRGFVQYNPLVFTPDSTAMGTGGFDMGNPYEVNPGSAVGGGTGPHMSEQAVSTGSPLPFAQDWAQSDPNDPGSGLCKNPDAECNRPLFIPQTANCDEYAYSQSPTGDNCWDKWVDHWVMNTQYTLPQPWSEFGPFYRDYAMCWNYNLRDTINLENWLWLKRAEYVDPRFVDPIAYPGYNEIPIRASYAGNPENIQALMIGLPVVVNFPEELRTKSNLNSQLEWYVDNGFLAPGVENVGNRPGSYVVFMRQIVDNNGNYSQQFFCADMDLPSYRIRHLPPDPDNPTGACYIEFK